MPPLLRGIPGEYDFALDGKGYLIADEMMTPFAPLRSSVAYRKLGRDLLVERRDFSQDISENKIDSLYWSSQRSWFAGAGQKRLDNPRFSNDEMFLRAKNVDPFLERGKLSLSHAIERQYAGAASDATEGFCTASDEYLYWAQGFSGPIPPGGPTLKSINLWGDAASSRDTDLTDQIEGLTNDGKYVYASNTTDGVHRGALTAQTTTLTSWSAQPLRDIAFVKDRIMGHTIDTGNVQIWEIDTATATAQQVGSDYNEGWEIRKATGAQDVFAEVAGFVCWVISNGPDGYVYTWNGTDDPVKAARFPSFQAWGLVSYAESVLYVIGRDPSGDPFDDRWAVIECQVSASGQITWDILHVIEDLPRPVAAVQDTQILIPCRLASDDTAGLTEDNGISFGAANVIAALNVANNALLPAKHWGRVDTAGPTIEDLLWGDVGFAEPDICVFRSALVLAGENGEIRAEVASFPPTGQLLSSAIDLNVDGPKEFLLAEASSEPMAVDASLALEVTFEDPDTETPTFEEVVRIEARGKSDRARLGAGQGKRAPFAHYRLTFASPGTDTPFARKAGLGAVYALKPRYEHEIYIKAYPTMDLRGGQPWPPERTSDVIQRELEALRDSQRVVDLQEPVRGSGARDAVKVQVREVEVNKTFIPKSGFASVIRCVLIEVPE